MIFSATVKMQMEHSKPPRIRRFPYSSASRKAEPEARWEPSPHDVVDDMITMARVTDTDLVYDLGCGDGRIVIAAAAKTGARGVGVDLDPRRIRQSCESAIRAGVDGLTRFANEDLFETDINGATVLFLFLLPEVNCRLRPKLLRELKPGTRIVSYGHGMGRWQPDRTLVGATNNAYLWIVPGNMSGVWDGSVDSGAEHLPLRMTMSQEFQQVSGVLFVGQNVIQVQSTVIEGATFAFGNKDDRHDRGPLVSLAGAVRGDTVTGTIQAHPFPEEPSPFTARLRPSTRVPLAQ
jgi:hypothetical protein